MGNTGIGAPVRRAEDLRLLTGRGRYSDDKNQPGQAYAVLLRSPHAHAIINGIDSVAAEQMPGVLAILTARDYDNDGLKPIAHGANNADSVNPRIKSFLEEEGARIFDVPQPPLARDKIRFGGEGVALVVAETVSQARDAAEHVVVDYTPLPATGHVMDAIAPNAAQIWDGAPGNISLDAVKGDQTATEAAFASAAHVVEMELPVTRVVNCQMEPRAAIAWHDSDTGRMTLYAGSQGANRLKMHLCPALDMAPELVRVITEDVGGGYGPRNALYPEFVLICWAAKRLGRPVKWTCERTEAFVADYQGRDLVTQAALALDSDGNFLAMRTRMIGAVGGHTVAYVSLNNGFRLTTSLYDIPAAHAHIQGVLTNTPSTSPYRGAGRPEAMFVIERLIDGAADQFGFDRIALRRKNLIPLDGFPYHTAMGMTFDCGEFETNMDSTMALADWDGFEVRRAEAKERGKLLGIGLANYIEAPVGAPMERAEIAIDPDEGRVRVIIGTQSQGQGHETSFRQVITEWLGVPFDDIDIITGDTDVVKAGGGTHSDRSIRMAGNVMVKASEKIIEIGRDAAVHLLEAAREDIAFTNGRFSVTGTDREIGIFDVAAAIARGDVPNAPEGGLAAEDDFFGRLPAFPNGCVVCEVEVDPDTGDVAITRYSTVDDVGRVVNPMIVHGQTHGGIAMGVGQALLENAWYDPESGQLLAGSFMDYCVARADDLPSFNVELNEVPSAGNPLGVKGGGEGGTTPALAVVISAVVDALKDYGVKHIDLPATSEKIWRAIQQRAHR
ncbi:MAG: xanthine dehydrogenase family protein molybdopterin-binding subunit [Rhodospirillales bacterium]|nr:xanthine dehydrogenase family protein molybdopterin-binding subunit [Rhodospirillales bacterium]